MLQCFVVVFDAVSFSFILLHSTVHCWLADGKAVCKFLYRNLQPKVFPLKGKSKDLHCVSEKKSPFLYLL